MSLQKAPGPYLLQNWDPAAKNKGRKSARRW